MRLCVTARVNEIVRVCVCNLFFAERRRVSSA